MKRSVKALARLLVFCLFLSVVSVPASAESDDKNSLFFAGYRWLSPYSALFDSAEMENCVGVTMETGLIWALSREGSCLLALYADQNGNSGKVYVEESRTSRAVRIDIAKWMNDTGKEEVAVSQQTVAPVRVGLLTEAAEAGTKSQEPPATGLQILSQPEDLQAQAGEEVTFSVSVQGAAACQWQYSKDGGNTWDDLRNAAFWTGCKTDTLTFTADEKYGGFLFRCVVSDQTDRLESLPARLIIPGKVVPFDEKPSDRLAAPGASVSFHASLKNAEKYRWQYSKDGGLSWGDLTNGEFWQGNKTDTLSFTVEQKHDGFLFRCGVLYENETVYSDSARLTVVDDSEVLPVIRNQSGDVTVREGKAVTFSVEADNARTYQWQYSKDGGKTWTPLRNSKVWGGNEAAELTFNATLSQDETLFRCAVTNPAGTVESQPVRLSVLFK